jgi:hypothetical protein
LLTIMCIFTRFPEAIPLRNIKAKTIVKALTKFFFSFVGVPKAIQSDQGSTFLSGLYQQVMHELSDSTNLLLIILSLRGHLNVFIRPLRL